MSDEWYYTQHGKQHGMADWTPAGSIPELSLPCDVPRARPVPPPLPAANIMHSIAERTEQVVRAGLSTVGGVILPAAARSFKWATLRWQSLSPRGKLAVGVGGAVLALVWSLLVLALLHGSKPGMTKEQGSDKSTDPTNITVRQIAEDYLKDRDVAELKYKDKKIAVSGVYLGYEPSYGGIILEIGEDLDPKVWVFASFAAKYQDQVSRLDPPKDVTFTGLFPGKRELANGRLVLKFINCELLNDPAASTRSAGQKTRGSQTDTPASQSDVRSGIKGNAKRSVTDVDNQVITEDYLPHKPGSTAEYLIDVPNGTARHRRSYASDGEINTTIVSIGEQFLNQHLSPSRRVIQDGFVGEVDEDGRWVKCLKLGARIGDTWRNRKNNAIKYTIESFGEKRMKYDNVQRPSVTILFEKADSPTELEIREVYARGIGLINKTGRSSTFPVHWELKEERKESNLTKAEKAFYE
jgi:hypothetical protein